MPECEAGAVPRRRGRSVMLKIVRYTSASIELAQNGVRREAVSDSGPGGARRTLCALLPLTAAVMLLTGCSDSAPDTKSAKLVASPYGPGPASTSVRILSPSSSSSPASASRSRAEASSRSSSRPSTTPTRIWRRWSCTCACSPPPPSPATLPCASSTPKSPPWVRRKITTCHHHHHHAPRL